MKIKDYIDAHTEFTQIASNVNRQLMFSGIAVIWLFKYTDDTSKFNLPSILLIPLLLLVLGLIFDLFQYIAASIIWYVFYRELEKDPKIDKTTEIESSPNNVIFLNIFFYGKFVCIIAAYFFIISYLFTTIKFT